MLPGDNPDYEDKSRFPIAFAAGVVIVLLLGAGVALVIRKTQPKVLPQPTSFLLAPRRKPMLLASNSRGFKWRIRRIF
jgi:hypothetical protein